jgi:SOS-response transcriptional repressor LexA
MELQTLAKNAVEKAGNSTKLAEKLELSRTSIERWLHGGSIGLEDLDRLLRYIGGDLTRALPDYHPEPETPPVEITIWGRVSAGPCTLATEHPETLPSQAHAWQKSRYRNLTSGQVIFLQVDGDSMEPQFPNGSLLACAKPNTRELPDLTPVIARIGDECTFKLYRPTTDRKGTPEIELLPLNRTYRTTRHNPRDITIDYIALGVLNPWVNGIE